MHPKYAYKVLAAEMMHDRKAKLVQVRMTNLQLEHVRRLAKLAKCSVSEYIRSVLATSILKQLGYEGGTEHGTV